ncbi:MAG: AAA family ATPase [Lactobacillus crispatus]
MTELNRIEQAIKEIDPATFQKLCDEYERIECKAKGMDVSLVPLGSEDGKNKTTKGTPDSYIITSDGKYILMEYTSQEKKILQKVKDDLSKIGNSDIDKNKIEEIKYFSATSDIEPEDIQAIQKFLKKKKIKFEFVSNHRLATDISDKYRSLAEGYLGFVLKPRQLMTAKEFEKDFNGQYTGASTYSYFAYRKDELEQLNNKLQNKNVVILTGPTGVGKTRLAYEYIKKYGDQVFFVNNVFDINALISEIQSYIEDSSLKAIVFDDANRINDLEKIFQAFQRRLKKSDIKIILTVRSYAKNDIYKELSCLANVDILELTQLSAIQIRECIEKIYNIKDDIVLDRIGAISYGNLRFALLSAKVFNKNHKLSDISDFSQVFQQLLGNILPKNHLDTDSDRLISLGIIAFLKHFDITKIGYYKPILEKLKISEKEFKENVDVFTQKELINVVNHRYVFFEDQVICSYVLKIVFLDQRLIPLDFMINTYFKYIANIVRDNVQILGGFFQNEENNRYVVQQVKKSFQFFHDQDEILYLQFVSMFCSYDINSSVSLVLAKIKKVKPQKTDIDDKIGCTPFLYDSLLEIIGGISYKEPKLAVQLFYKYLVKVPQKISQFKSAVNEFWSIRFNTFRVYKFAQQIALINELIKHFPEKAAQQLFLAIVSDFLKLTFQTANEIPNEKAIIIMQDFAAFKTPEYVKFRQNIWKGLMSLTDQKTNYRGIKHILTDYSRNLRLTIINKPNSVHDVIENDKRYLVKIIPILFSSSNLTDCEVVADIVESFNKLDIGMPSLKKFSTNSTFKFYQKLSIQLHSKDFDESKFIKEFSEKLRLLKQLVDLLEKIDNGITAYEISDILKSLIKDIEENHLDVAEIILKSKKTVEYVNIQFFNYLFKEFELKKIIDLIQDANVDHQDLLWYYFFSNIPCDKVNKETFNMLKQWLNHETEEDVGNTINRNILFAQKFNRVNEHALEECCIIVWSKGEKFRKIYFRYVSLDEKQSSVLVKSFENIALLEDIYLFILKRNSQYGDYSGHIFKNLYKKDTDFLIRYIDDILIPQIKDSYLVRNKYELVNLIASYYGQTVLGTIWDYIYQTKQPVIQMAYIRFLVSQLDNVQNNVSKQIDKWLTTLIQKNDDDTIKLQIIFDGLSDCDDLSIYHRYIKVLILTKPSSNFFNKIHLDKCSLSWDVSEAGIKEVFGKEIEQLQKLSKWTGQLGLDYFEYKRIIDQRAEVLQKELRDLLDRLDAGID